MPPHHHVWLRFLNHQVSPGSKSISVGCVLYELTSFAVASVELAFYIYLYACTRDIKRTCIWEEESERMKPMFMFLSSDMRPNFSSWPLPRLKIINSHLAESFNIFLMISKKFHVRAFYLAVLNVVEFYSLVVHSEVRFKTNSNTRCMFITHMYKCLYVRVWKLDRQ